MARISHVRHVLAVPDVARSSSWYQEVLGFTELFAVRDDWRFLQREACGLMLGQCPDAMPVTATGDHSYAGYWVVDDARTLHDRWQERGVTLVKPLRDEPWGMCEFGIRTPDGHRFMIGQVTAAAPADDDADS